MPCWVHPIHFNALARLIGIEPPEALPLATVAEMPHTDLARADDAAGRCVKQQAENRPTERQGCFCGQEIKDRNQGLGPDWL
jgi:hypothetical protein